MRPSRLIFRGGLATLYAATANVAAATTNLQSMLLPINTPAPGVIDASECASHNLTSFFDQVPSPTGEARSAIVTYFRSLRADCSASMTGDRETDRHLCIWGPPLSSWCELTTRAPPEALPALSSWGTEASSWLAARTAQAVPLARSCPVAWHDARNAIFMADLELNRTIISALCFGGLEEKEEVAETSTAATGTRETAAPGAGTTADGSAKTGDPSWGVRIGVDRLAVAGCGLAIAAISM
jgi:hypothetical protein